MEQLISMATFAERLGCSPATAYRIVAAGRIDWTDIGIGGRPRIRISERAFRKYVDGRTEQGRVA